MLNVRRPQKSAALKRCSLKEEWVICGCFAWYVTIAKLTPSNRPLINQARSLYLKLWTEFFSGFTAQARSAQKKRCKTAKFILYCAI